MYGDGLCRAWNDEHLCGLLFDHPGDHRCSRPEGCDDVWNRGDWDEPGEGYDSAEEEWAGTAFFRPGRAHASKEVRA